MAQDDTFPFAKHFPVLKPESLACLERFKAYIAPKHTRPFPLQRTASVAIVLFVGRKGDIYVLLSSRAGGMRTYAGDSALPGGRYEPGDEDPEGTARREAWEEVGLPMDKDKVVHLTNLDVFLAGNHLIVTPVVLFVLDPTMNPVLNPSEVTSIFSMPLVSFLHKNPRLIPGWENISSRVVPLSPEATAIMYHAPKPPYIDSANDVVVGKDTAYYQYRDISWGQGTVRMHRFLTGREAGGIKPVFGLTAGILVQAASLGYNHTPAFEPFAPDQLPMSERIEYAMRQEGRPLGLAAKEEGIWDAWKPEPSRSKL